MQKLGVMHFNIVPVDKNHLFISLVLGQYLNHLSKKTIMKVHSDYLVRIFIVLNEAVSAGGGELMADRQWFVKGQEHSASHLLKYIFFESNIYTPILLPEFTEKDAKNLLDFLISKKMFSGTIFGGVGIIDTQTGEMVTTDWDLGDIADWWEILKKLKKNREVIHTHQPTDAVFELKFIDQDVTLQELD